LRREEMNEWDILKGLETVKAPPHFEQEVLAGLSLRARVERRRRSLALRWAMAGSFASLAAAALLLNVFVIQGPKPSDIAKGGEGAAGGAPIVHFAGEERTIPVIETLDYRTEIRSRSAEPETVYLLEQVSDTAPRGIRY
jgi:hypothetical protein